MKELRTENGVWNAEHVSHYCEYFLPFFAIINNIDHQRSLSLVFNIFSSILFARKLIKCRPNVSFQKWENIFIKTNVDVECEYMRIFASMMLCSPSVCQRSVSKDWSELYSLILIIIKMIHFEHWTNRTKPQICIEWY